MDKNHEIFTLQVNFLKSYILIKLYRFFLSKYTLNIKHNEIDRLENHLHQQERLLNKSEKNLLEDISLFDQFLDTFNRNANDVTLR